MRSLLGRDEAVAAVAAVAFLKRTRRWWSNWLYACDRNPVLRHPKQMAQLYTARGTMDQTGPTVPVNHRTHG